jgi:Ca-activated chloride channel family protein
VDYSQSMRPNVPALVAAVSALARSGTGDDEFFVLPFNDLASSASGNPFLGNNGDRLRAQMAETLPAGGTALYDAVIEGIRRMGFARWEKRALIVVSDGDDNASTARRAETTALARRSNVIIYAVAVPAPGGKRSRRADDLLRRLSNGSGGVARFAPSIADVEETMLRFGRDLRQQYMLGFSPGKNESKGPRAISVTVVAPGQADLRVRFRASYEARARSVR